MDEPNGFSSATSNDQWGEISDSSSSSRHVLIKYPTNNGSPSASKFKGVVSQPNGHWGAQIYANHQRIWLGTFKSETEAAMAYDSAAIKLRNGFTNRNFPWTGITVREPNFQDQFSTEMILAMIKDGSYAAKFSDYLRADQDRQGYNLGALRGTTVGVNLRQLFQKELTPSDVSKLNRLVIPKKYALKYFPPIFDFKKRNEVDSVDDIELMFFDRSMRSWNFRYCYWKSSQSFVFTRGWNRFAKEKGLRSRDRIIFSSYECNEHKLCMIDVEYEDGGRGGPVTENEEALQIDIGKPGLNLDGNDSERMDLQVDVEMGENEIEGENVATISCDHHVQKKGLRLFGVQIV